jgi:hypothetical protein
MSMSRSPPWLRSKFELDVTGFRGTRRERDWDELGLAGVEVASALPASSVRRHLCGRLREPTSITTAAGFDDGAIPRRCLLQLVARELK